MDNIKSKSQLRIIEALAKAERQLRPVLVSGLVTELGLRGQSSITDTLKLLERQELIEIIGGGSSGSPRIIRLSAIGKRFVGLGGLPVLGSIAAGNPKEAVTQCDEWVDIGNSFKTLPDDFLLRVDGLSMKDEGIFPGDLAHIRMLQPTDGAIVAARIGDDYHATLKRVYFRKDHVILKASNPDFKEIKVPASEWRGVSGVYQGNLIRNAQ